SKRFATNLRSKPRGGVWSACVFSAAFEPALMSGSIPPAPRFYLCDGHAPAVKVIEQSKSFRIVILQPYRTIFRFWSGHVQIAVSAEIPHRQFREELVGITTRVGFYPESLGQ